MICKMHMSKIHPVILSAMLLFMMQFSLDIRAADLLDIENKVEVQNPSTIVLGDLDGDAEVTEKDNQLFKEYFAGKDVVIPNFRAADVNEDGEVNRKDAMILARYLAEWDGYFLGKESDSDKLPWEEVGGKQPSEYTWEEYEALSKIEQDAFFRSFENEYDFYEWLAYAQDNAILPWENGGKAPSEYTLDEYNALSSFLQDKFYESFDSAEEFEQWMNKASGNGLLPWEEVGAKQPNEYTWEEYEALTQSQKDAFFRYFEDVTQFDTWLTYAQANAKVPWKEPDAKQPPEYTWEEYEALSDFLKDAFFESFEDPDDFDEWWAANQPQ